MTKQHSLQRWLTAFAVFALALLTPAASQQPAKPLETALSQHYLIISADLFADHLGDFIALKESQGYLVTLVKVSEIGATKEAIQARIKFHYESSHRPDYLLLVGDDNFIPAWPIDNGPFKTDFDYSTMHGPTDSLPDIAVGRVPVRNTEHLEHWISKMLAYEESSGQEEWMLKASFIAPKDSGWAATAERGHNHVIEQYTEPNGFTGDFPSSPQPGGDKLYGATNGADHYDVVRALNSGREIAVYNGPGDANSWLDPLFSRQDVQLHTGSPIPLVISLAPYSADFSTVESLADTWVTKSNSGALTYIGLSADGDVEKNEKYEAEFFDGYFSTDSETATIGQAFLHALIRLHTSSDCKPFKPCLSLEPFQLFGDPSLKILLEPKAPDFALTAAPAHLGVCGNGQVTASIQVEGRFGFSSQVDLFYPVLLAGTAGSIQPDSIQPGEQALLTLTNTGTPAGDYHLAVEGASGGLLRQAGLLYSVYDGSPPEVTLLHPAPFTPNAPLRPEFSWVGQNAFSYDLEIATDHEFKNIHSTVAGLSEPRFTPAEDLPPGVTYWWRVRAHNPCGQTVASLPERFTTRAEAGQCAAGDQPNQIFSEDFEEEPVIWCPAQNPDGWSLVNKASHSPENSCFADSYIFTPGDNTLVTPEIQLPGPNFAPIMLSFWSKHIFENQFECKDGGLLEISLKEGTYWTPIPEENLLTIPYDGLISSEHKNPLGNQRAWCGTREWSRVVALLDDFAGQSVRLRWRLGTDDSTQEGAGWYVDDVAVTSCTHPPPPGVALQPQSSRVSGPPNGQVVHTLEVTNTGPEPASFVLQVTEGEWQTEIAPPSLDLDPGESQPVTVSVTVPDQTSPGDSDLATLTVLDANDHAVHATAQIETLVKFYQLALECAQPSLSGMPGSEVGFEVTLRNTGTEADAFALILTAPNGWLVEVPQEVGPLLPGDTQIIPVKVTIPPGTSNGTRAFFTLKAQSQGDADALAQLDLEVTSAWPRLFMPLIAHP